MKKKIILSIIISSVLIIGVSLIFILNPNKKVFSLLLDDKSEPEQSICSSMIVFDDKYMGEFFQTVQNDRTMKGIQEFNSGNGIHLVSEVRRWLKV